MSKIKSLKDAMRRPIRTIALFSIATNLLLLAPPLHMLQIYDRVLSSQSRSTLFYITAITIAAIAAYSLAEVVRGRVAHRLAATFMSEIAELVFNGIVRSRDPSMDERKIMRDMQNLRMFFASRQFVGLFDLPFSPFFLLLLFALHLTLGLIALVGIVLLVGLTIANNKMTESAGKEANDAETDAAGFSAAVLTRAEDIRAMGLLPSVVNRWGEKTARSLNRSDDSSVYTNAFFGAGRFVRQSLQVITMAWGAYLVLNGDMSGGMIFAASMILGRTLAPVEALIGIWDTLQRTRASWNSVSTLIEQLEDEDEATLLPNPVGRIAVENLVYTPPNVSKPVLSGISFVLEPGTILAVAGPSGAGKSTLARLVAGAISPTGGAVRLDNFKLEQWRDDQRGRYIGYVPQDISLFPGTISENIARLQLDPDDADIVRAAQLADIHEMIAALPDGYMTRIGPKSHALSGGQRQRLALARAFFSAPRVLVLDEPNAHLDVAGERSLMECLIRAKEMGTAILVVSQRRSLLQIADRVMTLSGGAITAMVDQQVEQSYIRPLSEMPPKPDALVAQLKRAAAAGQQADLQVRRPA